MAIFHLSIKIISRSGGRSIIAAAAYRSGTRIKDEETGIVHDFRRKRGVTYSEIMLCEHAPPDYRSRKELWSSVQRVEKSKDAVVMIRGYKANVETSTGTGFVYKTDNKYAWNIDINIGFIGLNFPV